MVFKLSNVKKLVNFPKKVDVKVMKSDLKISDINENGQVKSKKRI